MSTYAIIVDGGRQYKVSEGLQLDIDYRDSATAGDMIEFDAVLAVGGDDGFRVGKPTIEGAKVKAKVISTSKGPKLYIQKFRRRKGYRRRTGHRQKFTRIEIAEISA